MLTIRMKPSSRNTKTIQIRRGIVSAGSSRRPVMASSSVPVQKSTSIGVGVASPWSKAPSHMPTVVPRNCPPRIWSVFRMMRNTSVRSWMSSARSCSFTVFTSPEEVNSGACVTPEALT